MPYPPLTDCVFAIGDIQSSKRGQKFAPITVDDQPAVFLLTPSASPLYAPFGCNVYQGNGTETRLNLDLEVQGDLLELFRRLDNQLMELIGPQKTSYHSLLSEGEYGSRIRPSR